MNKKLGIAAAIAFVGVVAFTVGMSVKTEQASFGISQRASKFTDVEVTNEVQVRTLTLTGSSTVAGNLTVSGETNVVNFVQGGTVESFSTSSASYALNSSDVCDNSFLSINATSPVTTWTLPASSTLFSDCLTVDGDFKDLSILNGSSATSSIIAAGTGGTLTTSTSATIPATDTASLRIIRNSSSTYRAQLTNQAL